MASLSQSSHNPVSSQCGYYCKPSPFPFTSRRIGEQFHIAARYGGQIIARKYYHLQASVNHEIFLVFFFRISNFEFGETNTDPAGHPTFFAAATLDRSCLAKPRLCLNASLQMVILWFKRLFIRPTYILICRNVACKPAFLH